MLPFGRNAILTEESNARRSRHAAPAAASPGVSPRLSAPGVDGRAHLEQAARRRPGIVIPYRHQRDPRARQVRAHHPDGVGQRSAVVGRAAADLPCRPGNRSRRTALAFGACRPAGAFSRALPVADACYGTWLRQAELINVHPVKGLRPSRSRPAPVNAAAAAVVYVGATVFLVSPCAI